MISILILLFFSIVCCIMLFTDIVNMIDRLKQRESRIREDSTSKYRRIETYKQDCLVEQSIEKVDHNRHNQADYTKAMIYHFSDRWVSQTNSFDDNYKFKIDDITIEPMIDFKDIPFGEVDDKPKKIKINKVKPVNKSGIMINDSTRTSNLILDLESAFEVEEVNLPPFKTVGNCYISPKFLLKQGENNMKPGSIFMDARKDIIKDITNLMSDLQEFPKNMWDMYNNIGILNNEGLKELVRLYDEHVGIKSNEKIEIDIKTRHKIELEKSKIKQYR